jgi:hypothetical protein
MSIVKSKHASNYTVLPNELFKSGLSLEAIGLLSYFLSLPHDWVIYKTQLHTQLNMGRDKIDRIFKELQNSGYIVSIKQINKDGRFAYSHIIYDKPYNGEPHTGFSSTEEQPLLSKEEQSTKKINNIIGDTTDLVNGALDLWQDKNNNQPPLEPSIVPPKKERKTPTSLHHRCVEFYCKDFRPIGWGEFTAKDGKNIKGLIDKISKFLKDFNHDVTDDKVLEKFKSLLLNLPEFYKTKDLATIESKFFVIVNELKEKNKSTENKPWLRADLSPEEHQLLTPEQKKEWARVILKANI